MLATATASLAPDAGVTEDGSITTSTVDLLVQLPPQMLDYFEQSGYLSSVYGEQRSNARLRVRCVAQRETISVPAFVRNRTLVAKVLMKDLSRSGIGILSHEQLWPGETMLVHVMERSLCARVVRCRKLGPCCYEVGGVLM